MWILLSQKRIFANSVHLFKFKAKIKEKKKITKNRKKYNESLTTRGFSVDVTFIFICQKLFISSFLFALSEEKCIIISYLLEEEDDSLDHFGSLLLQAEEGTWCADEDLCFAIGHIMVKSTPLQEPLHCIFVWWQVMIWPCKLWDHLVSGGRRK